VQWMTQSRARGPRRDCPDDRLYEFPEHIGKEFTATFRQLEALFMKKLESIVLLATVIFSFFGATECPAQSGPPSDMATVATLSFTVGKDAQSSVQLPAGTRRVYFGVQNGSLFCKSVKLGVTDGSTSSVFADSEMPNKAHMIQGARPQMFYTAVDLNCRSVDPGAHIVIGAGK
jgi:hypothetical protein